MSRRKQTPPEPDRDQILEDLKRSNAERIDSLTREGLPVDILSIMQLRLNLLLTTLFDEDGLYAFELAFQEAIADQTSQAEAALRQATLLAGVTEGGAGEPASGRKLRVIEGDKK